ncbi:hypothetical protein ADL04_00980 [Streptomyces sp. NRRL B-3648]|nr:hypothetical protein ADL04_00980 [Streptomyces sp. NRRL B-3648]
MGLLVLHQEAGVFGLGMQRVECDHRIRQVERCEQRREDGDLMSLGADVALGGDQAGAGHRGEQVDLDAVGTAGASDRLAVHRQRAAAPRARRLAEAGARGPGRRAKSLQVISFGESAVADEGSCQRGEGQEVVGLALVAAVQAPAAGEPGDGAFDDPAVSAQVCGVLDAASGDARDDAARA